VQAKSHPHRGTWWGVVMDPPPWLFAMFQYFGGILPLVESRRSAAGGMEKLKT